MFKWHLEFVQRAWIGPTPTLFSYSTHTGYLKNAMHLFVIYILRHTGSGSEGLVKSFDR